MVKPTTRVEALSQVTFWVLKQADHVDQKQKKQLMEYL